MRMDTKLIYEDETYAIRGAIFEVYKTLGDGYLEDVYQGYVDKRRCGGLGRCFSS